MELGVYIKALVALVFVVGLIGLVSYILRRFVVDKEFIKLASKDKRLSIIEMKPLDAKRRLVIVKKDNKEHLLLIGGGNDVVVESSDAGGAV